MVGLGNKEETEARARTREEGIRFIQINKGKMGKRKTKINKSNYDAIVIYGDISLRKDKNGDFIFGFPLNPRFEITESEW